MNKIILYFIRHGKTMYNEKRLYCGKSDIPLSEGGKKELIILKETISYPKVKLYYTSGAKRANDTMALLYPTLCFTEIKDLFEYNFGDFEGKSYEDLKDNKDYLRWISDCSNKVKCIQGENKEEFYLRITNGLKQLVSNILEKNELEGVVVCHGGVIGTLLQLYSKLERDFYSLQPSYGKGYKVEVRIGEEIELKVLGEI